ncbi:MAG TPA: hypothetical protein PKC59_03350 [Burkholderiaceae bacterium]|nr:hypothetical protein [Burkholderiaceae bacterium]HMY98797.1 hypothetical protein [Burkholderiaceae bacterium]HNB43701.1 hypothetical protein [Burkholderiaceae bacterium]HNG79826.1 hypothetical protein [Burkholderiaceae bacterium]
MSSISIPSLPPAGQTGGLALIAREAAPQAARITARVLRRFEYQRLLRD